MIKFFLLLLHILLQTTNNILLSKCVSPLVDVVSQGKIKILVPQNINLEYSLYSVVPISIFSTYYLILTVSCTKISAIYSVENFHFRFLFYRIHCQCST